MHSFQLSKRGIRKERAIQSTVVPNGLRRAVTQPRRTADVLMRWSVKCVPERRESDAVHLPELPSPVRGTWGSSTASHSVMHSTVTFAVDPAVTVTSGPRHVPRVPSVCT